MRSTMTGRFEDMALAGVAMRDAMTRKFEDMAGVAHEVCDDGQGGRAGGRAQKAKRCRPHPTCYHGLNWTLS
jgi:hypothetical protein